MTAKLVEARGGSMRPLFASGELLALRPAGRDGLHPGDCVAYRLDGSLLIHRLWWKTPAHAWIKDDAGGLGLHAVAWDSVEGAVVDPRLRASGLPGLAWGLAVVTAYSLLRPLKRAVSLLGLA